MTTCGVHTFGVWDRAFAAARAWGFFEPVPERPRALGLPHRGDVGRDVGPPLPLRRAAVAVATFKRSGRTLTATGSGRVEITGAAGCRFRLRLPFERRLELSCYIHPIG